MAQSHLIEVSALTILNMLIGVLCEVVSAVAEAEKEKAVVTYVKANSNHIYCYSCERLSLNVLPQKNYLSH